MRELARDFAGSESAAAYGRTGACLGRFATLVAFLLDALNAVTGNVDRPGGSVFGDPPIPIDVIGERIGLATYGEDRSRFGDFPDVLGEMPASLLPLEITTPGERQIRALFVSAGNPVLSVPDGDALEAALGELDLMVSLDFYVNETNRHADYVLPTTTMYERDDVPVALMSFFSTPVRPGHRGGDRAARRGARGVGDHRRDHAPDRQGALQRARRCGRWRSWAFACRRSGWSTSCCAPGRGATGSACGRSGLSVAKLLRRHPHGLVLSDHVKTGLLRASCAPRRSGSTSPRRRSWRSWSASAAGRADDAEFPLRLIGLRELRSHNSWMHNAPLLMRGERVQALRVHPDDAAEHGLEDGGTARLESKSGPWRCPWR